SHQARPRAERYLNALGLWEKRDEQARMLSGGMKRRLMIARALIHEPRLLILDEPTAGVDIELRRSMWEFLQKINAEGVTIILTTHYLEEAEALCRNIAIIDQGRILENTTKRALLQKLHMEVFILDIPESDLDKLQLSKTYQFNVNSDGAVEVAVNQGQTLNSVFAELEHLGVSVSSMRTKSNRLEELFVDLVQQGDKTGQGEKND
ncbi:MAG: ABC transporter ATP-binding protein, partial [Pseudomonadales bacterium]|nr:ABC transporter ATP-binding protein [Pseudomonadales bacterium]